MNIKQRINKLELRFPSVLGVHIIQYGVSGEIEKEIYAPENADEYLTLKVEIVEPDKDDRK